MDSAWECECGNVEYNSMTPEECEKCFRIGSFTQLPEELLEERAKERDHEERVVIKKTKAKSKGRKK